MRVSLALLDKFTNRDIEMEQIKTALVVTMFAAILLIMGAVAIACFTV